VFGGPHRRHGHVVDVALLGFVSGECGEKEMDDGRAGKGNEGLLALFCLVGLVSGFVLFGDVEYMHCVG
jgi:hypothetical protein